MLLKSRYLTIVLCLGVTILSLFVSSCGDPAATTVPASTPAPTTAPVTTTTLNVVLNEWSITLDKTTIPAGAVQFQISNAGKFPHDFIMTGANNFMIKSAIIESKQATNSSTDQLPAGTYTIICDVQGHKEKGMQVTLTVK